VRAAASHGQAAATSTSLFRHLPPLCVVRRMRDDLQAMRDKTTELEIKVDRVSSPGFWGGGAPAGLSIRPCAALLQAGGLCADWMPSISRAGCVS
jgi:hypothetical protein